MFFQAGRTTLRSSSSDDADQHGGQARALNTLLPALDARHSLDCDHFLSTGPSVFDRVLESTSTKEKMAKYQAAVFKQSGAQPVSSHRTVHIDTGASRTMRPYLCVQPAKFLSSVSLPPSLCLSAVQQDATPEAPALKTSAPADQKHTPAPQCNGEWVRMDRCETELTA